MASLEQSFIMRSTSIPSSSSPTLTSHEKRTRIERNEKEDDDAMSNMIRVCRSGDSQELKSLLKKPDIILNLKYKGETTPLHEACCSGNVECISLLLKQGADANIYDARGYAPIHCAAYNNNCDAIKSLLDYTPPNLNFTSRCKLDQLSEQGETPLHVACMMGNMTTIYFLHESKASLECVSIDMNTILHYVSASDSGDLWGWVQSKLMPDLLHLVDKKNVHGWTPAHMAASLGNIVSISALVTFSANFDMKDNEEATPIDILNRHGNTKCFSIATKQQPPIVIKSSPPPLRITLSGTGRTLSDDGGGGMSPAPALRRRSSITGQDRPMTMSFQPPSPRVGGHRRRPSNLSQKSLTSRTSSMDSFLSVSRDSVTRVLSRLNSANSEEIIQMAIDTTAYEPPPELLVVPPICKDTISQEKSTIYCKEHKIKLSRRYHSTKKDKGDNKKKKPPPPPPPLSQELPVCIAAAMHHYLPFPEEYTIISPICFVSCKSEHSCPIMLSLPHAVDIPRGDKIDKKMFSVLSFHTYDLDDSEVSPVESPMERRLNAITVKRLVVEYEVITFEISLRNPSLFAIGVRNDAGSTIGSGSVAGGTIGAESVAGGTRATVGVGNDTGGTESNARGTIDVQSDSGMIGVQSDVKGTTIGVGIDAGSRGVGIQSDAGSPVPRPLLLPLRCILFCVYENLNEHTSIRTVPVKMYVGLALPTVTEIIAKECSSTNSSSVDVPFTLKDDRISLKASFYNDDEHKWELDISHSQQIFYDEVALKKHTGNSSYSHNLSYPPHKVVSITPSSKIGTVDKSIHLEVSILDTESERVTSVKFIPFAPWKSTTATPSHSPPGHSSDRGWFQNVPRLLVSRTTSPPQSMISRTTPSPQSTVSRTTPPPRSTVSRTTPPPQSRTTPPSQSMVSRTTPPPPQSKTTPTSQSMVSTTTTPPPPQYMVLRATPPPRNMALHAPQSIMPRTLQPSQSNVSKTTPPPPLTARTTPPLRSTPPGVLSVSSSTGNNGTVVTSASNYIVGLHISGASNTKQNESIV